MDERKKKLKRAAQWTGGMGGGGSPNAQSLLCNNLKRA